MKDRKNKKLLGIISVALWAIILISYFFSLVHHISWKDVWNFGKLTSIIFSISILIVAFFLWWIYKSVKMNKFAKRFNNANFAYMTSHDADAYLSELDACAKMDGIEKYKVSKVPAKDFLTISKIQVLREAGRKDEGLALLKTAQQEIKDENSQALLKVEAEKWS